MLTETEFLWGPILLLLLLNLRSGIRANGSSKDSIICRENHHKAKSPIIGLLCLHGLEGALHYCALLDHMLSGALLLGNNHLLITDDDKPQLGLTRCYIWV